MNLHLSFDAAARGSPAPPKFCRIRCIARYDPSPRAFGREGGGGEPFVGPCQLYQRTHLGRQLKRSPHIAASRRGLRAAGKPGKTMLRAATTTDNKDADVSGDDIFRGDLLMWFNAGNDDVTIPFNGCLSTQPE